MADLPGVMKFLPMSEIDRPAVLARDSIDPEKIRELAESIREIGLKEPIIVRPSNGRYEVVAGDRRYLAHRLIGSETILAIVEGMDDEETIIVRGTENLQREDLTPMEAARTYGTLRDKLGYSIEKICRKMGRTHTTINRYLGLLDLEPEFQDAVNSKRLSIEAAYVLAGVDDSEMRSYYLKSAVENGITALVARGWVEDYRRSREARFYDGGGGGGVSIASGEPLPTFRACEACARAVETSALKFPGVCPECMRKLVLGRVK